MHDLIQVIMQALGSIFMNLEIKLKSHHCVPPWFQAIEAAFIAAVGRKKLGEQLLACIAEEPTFSQSKRTEMAM